MYHWGAPGKVVISVILVSLLWRGFTILLHLVPAEYKNIQFLFMTFPCIGETVLRGKVVKFKDDKQTELFRDKQLLIDLAY